jgi:hypothetical protein
MIRTWTKTDVFLQSPRKCLRYDFGDYEGWLDGDQWLCYRILSTSKDGPSIIQNLEKMPADFCPFKAYSTEVVEIEGPLDAFQLAGWKVSVH